MVRFIFLTLTLITPLFLFSQKSSNTNWQGTIHRSDSNNIIFNFDQVELKGKQIIIVRNADEKIRVDSVVFTKDSVFIKMPVFESSFKAKVEADKWTGVWVKGTSGVELVLPFTAIKSNVRYPVSNGVAKSNITGRWSVSFGKDNDVKGKSIAEFKQSGSKLTGTFITATGDYRYLEGVVTGKHLVLSGFDGSHAVVFTADIENSKTINNGVFTSGAFFKDSWTAVRNANAKVKTDEVTMQLKPGEERLNFRFPDINGNMVSINETRFKNKVVVVQLMGSWCPNCMDETAFLSDYYNKNKRRGIEMIALAYEYSTDFKRSQASLRKFQSRFNVQYPILITGVTVSDTLRTEKTLPQVTKIKVFPSSIIIDKTGKVRKLDTGFSGPGTGVHYEAYKKEFYETIDKLLKE